MLQIDEIFAYVSIRIMRDETGMSEGVFIRRDFCVKEMNERVCKRGEVYPVYSVYTVCVHERTARLYYKHKGFVVQFEG